MKTLNRGILYLVNTKIVNSRKVLLTIVLLMLLFLFAYTVYQAISLNYLPVYADEYGYYLDAKFFQLYNRIDAVTTLNESYARVTGAGFHGFVYNVFYGTFFKLMALFGVEPSIMLVNMAFAAAALVWVAFLKIEFEKKALIAIFFLSNFIFITFISSSMTEIFHYVFSFMVAYLLYLVYHTGEKRYLYLFIALIVILSFFRQSWIFFLLALFPMANSWKDFIKYSFIFLLGLIFVLLDIKFFHAPFPFGFFQDLSEYLQSHSIVDGFTMVYKHFLSNIDKYFISMKYNGVRFIFYYKYLFVAVLLYSLYSSIRTKEKSILSGTLVAAAIFFALLALYDTYDWREVRMLSIPLVVLTVLLILNNKYIPAILIILFQVIVLDSVLEYQDRMNAKEENMNYMIRDNQILIDNFSDLGKYASDYNKSEIKVLLAPEIFPISYSPQFYTLPLSLNGKIIKYSLIFGKGFSVNDSRSDMFISDKPEEYKNLKLIGHNDYYYFYRIVPDISK